jgi:hypothetical protein
MKKNRYLLFIFCVLLSAVLLWGCGGGDPGSPGSSGDIGTKINITEVTHDYLDEEIQWQIDAVQDICEGGTPEDFSDDFAVFDFETIPFNPNSTREPGDLYIQSYTVTYIPITKGAPPIEMYSGTASFTIPGNGTATDFEIFAIDAGRKVKMAQSIIDGIYTPENNPVQYSMKIKFFGHNEYGVDFELEWQTAIQISDYDNC